MRLCSRTSRVIHLTTASFLTRSFDPTQPDPSPIHLPCILASQSCFIRNNVLSKSVSLFFLLSIVIILSFKCQSGGLIGSQLQQTKFPGCFNFVLEDKPLHSSAYLFLKFSLTKSFDPGLRFTPSEVRDPELRHRFVRSREVAESRSELWIGDMFALPG